jgi:hypothetical protein
LQRWILLEVGDRELAAEFRSLAAGRCDGRYSSRLFQSEILEGYFGFRPAEPIRRGDGWINHGHLFEPRRIGIRRYNKARASLSRACRRLKARGLVECVQGAYCLWAAVELTDKGREWLSVNTVAHR